ncbi:MAG: hypothetical protein JO129_03435 [Candidatus Dependentiae bacterium]|nr:hypothetical protein [Candidatus Dependentiae bacterium]
MKRLYRLFMNVCCILTAMPIIAMDPSQVLPNQASGNSLQELIVKLQDSETSVLNIHRVMSLIQITLSEIQKVLPSAQEELKNAVVREEKVREEIHKAREEINKEKEIIKNYRAIISKQNEDIASQKASILFLESELTKVTSDENSKGVDFDADFDNACDLIDELFDSNQEDVFLPVTTSPSSSHKRSNSYSTYPEKRSRIMSQQSDRVFDCSSKDSEAV